MRMDNFETVFYYYINFLHNFLKLFKFSSWFSFVKSYIDGPSLTLPPSEAKEVVFHTRGYMKQLFLYNPLYMIIKMASPIFNNGLRNFLFKDKNPVVAVECP